MSRLYKSLEDYDMLRGIFSSLEGTKKITCDALEAEERGDFLEASCLYKQVNLLAELVGIFGSCYALSAGHAGELGG